MALIACKECGHQVAQSAERCPSCGAPTPRVAAGNNVLAFIGLGVLAFMAWFWFGLFKACASDSARQRDGSPPDTAFCAKNLDYYETFCKAYPKNCTEGPRKLARCDQAWDKH